MVPWSLEFISRKLLGLFGLAQQLAALCGSSSQLRIQFAGAHGLNQRVDDLRQSRKLASLDGVLVLRELDALSGIANCQKHLAAAIREPALPNALQRFDFDALAFGILAANHVRRRKILTGDLCLGHLLLLGQRCDHLFPRTLHRIDSCTNRDCVGELESLKQRHAVILSETVERVSRIQPSAKRASGEFNLLAVDICCLITAETKFTYSWTKRAAKALHLVQHPCVKLIIFA